MKLTLIGHDDRYAVEQLQMSLFGPNREGQMVSSLHRGKTWLTAVTTFTIDGRTTRGVRRMKALEETVRLRRRLGAGRQKGGWTWDIFSVRTASRR